jgi:hypothetical protein
MQRCPSRANRVAVASRRFLGDFRNAPKADAKSEHRHLSRWARSGQPPAHGLTENTVVRVSLTSSPADSSKVQRARPSGGLEQARCDRQGFLFARELTACLTARLFADRPWHVLNDRFTPIRVALLPIRC